MALRKIYEAVNLKTGRAVRVYRDAEWQEFRVRHYLADDIGLLHHQAEADYHDDDKATAMCHASTWVNGGI